MMRGRITSVSEQPRILAAFAGLVRPPAYLQRYLTATLLIEVVVVHSGDDTRQQSNGNIGAQVVGSAS